MPVFYNIQCAKSGMGGLNYKKRREEEPKGKSMEEDSGIEIKTLKVDGGACANDYLMLFQSNLLGCEVFRPCCIETTALGAAYLAGLAVGYWKNREDIRSNWATDKIFRSDISQDARDAAVKGWHKAVRCALLWGED